MKNHVCRWVEGTSLCCNPWVNLPASYKRHYTTLAGTPQSFTIDPLDVYIPSNGTFGIKEWRISRGQTSNTERVLSCGLYLSKSSVEEGWFKWGKWELEAWSEILPQWDSKPQSPEQGIQCSIRKGRGWIRQSNLNGHRGEIHPVGWMLNISCWVGAGKQLKVTRREWRGEGTHTEKKAGS